MSNQDVTEPTWRGYTADELVELADHAADEADGSLVNGDTVGMHRNDLRAILLREHATKLAAQVDAL